MTKQFSLKTYKAGGNIDPNSFSPVVEEKPLLADSGAPQWEDLPEGEEDDEDVKPHYYKIEDYGCSAIVKVSMPEDSNVWVEKLVKVLQGDPGDLRIGSSQYMSYLDPQQILSWMNRDYEQAKYLGTELPDGEA
jgi:hypothetical protein